MKSCCLSKICYPGSWAETRGVRGGSSNQMWVLSLTVVGEGLPHSHCSLGKCCVQLPEGRNDPKANFSSTTCKSVGVEWALPKGELERAEVPNTNWGFSENQEQLEWDWWHVNNLLWSYIHQSDVGCSPPDLSCSYLSDFCSAVKTRRCVLSSTGHSLFADEVGISSLINSDYRLLLDPLLEKTRLLSCGFNPLRTSHLHWVILGGRGGESSHQNTSLLHHLSAMALLWSYCSWAIYSHVLALSKEVQRGSSACASLREEPQARSRKAAEPRGGAVRPRLCCRAGVCGVRCGRPPGAAAPRCSCFAASLHRLTPSPSCAFPREKIELERDLL